MALQGIGSAATRPESDTCIVATSFNLELDRLNWERIALVVWLVGAPPSTSRVEVDAAFRRFFRLSPSELNVSRHFPEPFLVKFEESSRCAEVLAPRGTRRSLSG